MISKFKNELVLLRKLHQEWIRMQAAVLKTIILYFIIYLLIPSAFSSTSIFMQILLIKMNN